MMETTLSNQELVKKAFTYLNAFKRHRALEQINRQDGNHDQGNYHELKAYQLFDNLELSLRAIQKGLRDVKELEDVDKV